MFAHVMKVGSLQTQTHQNAVLSTTQQQIYHALSTHFIKKSQYCQCHKELLMEYRVPFILPLYVGIVA